MVKEVDITRLKDFVLKNLPMESALRELILSERDTMDVKTFLAKSDVCFKLLQIEYGK